MFPNKKTELLNNKKWIALPQEATPNIFLASTYYDFSQISEKNEYINKLPNIIGKIFQNNNKR